MLKDTIEAVGMDERGSLWVKPATATFPYVYREAIEIGWDAVRLCLYSPTPREWSYAAWFKQIMAAAREQGVELELSQTTSWSGIEPDLQQAITQKD